MKNKRIPVYITLLCFVALLSAVYFFMQNKYPGESKVTVNGEPLIGLNRASVLGKTGSGSKFLYYEFSQNQKVRFLNQKNVNAGYALRITLEGSEGDFYAGFLYDRDFLNNGKLKHSLDARPIVSGFFSHEHKSVSIMQSLSKYDENPSGFFIYSLRKAQILDAGFYNVSVGFDFSGDVPCFCFGNEGGYVDWNNLSFDFTSAKKNFSESNKNGLMPKVTFAFEPKTDYGSLENPEVETLVWGDEVLTVRRTPVSNQMEVQSSALKNPFTKISSERPVLKMLMSSSDGRLKSGSNGEVLYGLSTDLGLILDWPLENWRNPDYELYEWNLFPEVLFFDFADYRIQNQFFTRLAYFVEKAGYKGTLVGDDFVENKHGYNAHDYKALDLADFFNKVEEENFLINDCEILLRKILLENRIIIKTKNGMYKPGVGSVISISRESPDYLRRTLMAHESWHGIYFLDEDFRNVVLEVYDNFDKDSMEFIKIFWETQPGLGYDRTDEYLMKNEFMAYIMQQGFSNVQNYFLQIAGRGSVNRFEKELAQYVRDTKAEAFVHAADVLNNYAYNSWGLACGRVYLISKR